jgi:hypothetical protein
MALRVTKKTHNLPPSSGKSQPSCHDQAQINAGESAGAILPQGPSNLNKILFLIDY